MHTLRVLRTLLGIPAHELARASGVCEREVFRIETGGVRPKPETVVALIDGVQRIQEGRYAQVNFLQGRNKKGAPTVEAPEMEERRAADEPRNRAGP